MFMLGQSHQLYGADKERSRGRESRALYLTPFRSSRRLLPFLQ